MKCLYKIKSYLNQGRNQYAFIRILLINLCKNDKFQRVFSSILAENSDISKTLHALPYGGKIASKLPPGTNPVKLSVKNLNPLNIY